MLRGALRAVGRLVSELVPAQAVRCASGRDYSRAVTVAGAEHDGADVTYGYEPGLSDDELVGVREVLERAGFAPAAVAAAGSVGEAVSVASAPASPQPNLKFPDPAEMHLWPDWLLMSHAANCLPWPQHQRLVDELRTRATAQEGSPPAPFTFGDLAYAAGVIKAYAAIGPELSVTEIASLRSLADRLAEASEADPNP